MDIASVQLIHQIKPPTRRQETAQGFKASAELRLTYESGCIWLEGERGRVGVPLTNVASFTVAPSSTEQQARGTRRAQPEAPAS